MLILVVLYFYGCGLVPKGLVCVLGGKAKSHDCYFLTSRHHDPYLKHHSDHSCVLVSVTPFLYHPRLEQNKTWSLPRRSYDMYLFFRYVSNKPRTTCLHGNVRCPSILTQKIHSPAASYIFHHFWRSIITGIEFVLISNFSHHFRLFLRFLSLFDCTRFKGFREHMYIWFRL